METKGSKTMNFAVGSLVRARNREWVVLPESENDLLVLRPLGGNSEEVTGIYLPLEEVEPASFTLPSAQEIGDHRSCSLLRDAVRLGFRSSTGPFRSFARISVEPRPYQLVPLLMALKLDPVRLLIADDVGVGKTIEACLIVRELLDRGEITRFAVLSPPQLAEQWQHELEQKFHLEAELVLPSTVKKLEKGLSVGESLFERYPYVIVSTDYIKSTRRCDEFIRTCPQCVIVDEAHSCASAESSRASHQRFRLLSRIAENQQRHLILVTATPHSGKEDVFRSLLSFLKPEFAHLPEDLSGKENEHYRRELAAHFVQRRRADIRSYLQTNTPFPEREAYEQTYELSPAYKKFLERVLDYARETVQDLKDEVGSMKDEILHEEKHYAKSQKVTSSQSTNSSFILHPSAFKKRQRVKWWSVLALLRSIASSPVAAAATLRSRAANLDAETIEEADEIGRRTVLDLMIDDAAQSLDVIPGSNIWEDEETARNRRYLLSLAREAEKLATAHKDKDNKLARATAMIKKLIKDGFNPIVFCRFIPTAEYVAEHLRKAFSKVEIACVTGTLPPAEREIRVAQLAKAKKRILVCTDCLSEGINLQQYFNAVFHYDLSWNPTRHEQREGRVDRFGQTCPVVRVVTYYGLDNQIDGLVLDVLLRKHKKIRTSLGISVPVPLDSDKVIEAIFEGLLLRKKERTKAVRLLPGIKEYLTPEQEDFFQQWDKLVIKEKKSRTLFAQHTIKVEEVARELKAANEAIGTDLKSFTLDGLTLYGANITNNSQTSSVYEVDLSGLPVELKERLNCPSSLKISFQLPAPSDTEYIARTHPLVQNLASYIFDSALNSDDRAKAKRCGAIRTKSVTKRTTLLLLRLRFNLLTRGKDFERSLLAEECQVAGFAGSPANPQWLEKDTTLNLLQAQPDDIIYPEQAASFVAKVIDGYENLVPSLEKLAHKQARALQEAHTRVRTAAKIKGIKYKVTPLLPVDVLGIYVFLPAKV